MNGHEQWQSNAILSVYSDILTPLTALGVPFEIDDHKGPIIENKITTLDEVRIRSSAYTNNCTCGNP